MTEIYHCEGQQDPQLLNAFWPFWVPKEYPGKGESCLELLLGPDEVDGVLVDGRGQLLEELLLGKTQDCDGGRDWHVAGQLPNWPVRIEF